MKITMKNHHHLVCLRLFLHFLLSTIDNHHEFPPPFLEKMFGSLFPSASNVRRKSKQAIVAWLKSCGEGAEG